MKQFERGDARRPIRYEQPAALDVVFVETCENETRLAIEFAARLDQSLQEISRRVGAEGRSGGVSG